MATAAKLPEPQSKSLFAWGPKLETSHERPRKAILLEGQGPRGQRRVAIQGDYAVAKGMDWETTFFYNEDGTPSGETTTDWRLREAF